MRVAREDETLDPQVRVLLDARGDLLWVADQRRPGTATHQADAGPQIGRDLQVVAPPVMQRGHAPLTLGVEARERLLCGGNGFVADVFDQFVCGFPRFFSGFADDHMQTNPELHGAPVTGGTFTDIGEFLRHGGRWFAPGQVDIDLLGGQVVCGIGRAAEVQRRIRFLHRWIQRLGVLYPQVFAFEVHRFALQYPAPDFQELVGDFIAFAVIEEAAVATVFVGIAAGHDVDQQAATG